MRSELTLYDVSLAPGRNGAPWPGDRPFVMHTDMAHSRGDGWQVSSLSMSAHSGTHIEAPLHLFPDAKGLDSYPPERFKTGAVVIDSGAEERIPVADAESAVIEPGDAVLFRTRKSTGGLVRRKTFSESYVSLGDDTAEYLAARRCGIAGIDYHSVDPFDTETYSVHTILFRNDILILENIDLSAVPEGRYTLYVFPLIAAGIEASPVRAVLERP